jgi:hypothetical protein
LRQATNMDQFFRNGEVIWHTVAWYIVPENESKDFDILTCEGTVLTLPEEKKFWEGRIFNMPGWAKQLEPDDVLKIMLPASGLSLCAVSEVLQHIKDEATWAIRCHSHDSLLYM